MTNTKTYYWSASCSNGNHLYGFREASSLKQARADARRYMRGELLSGREYESASYTIYRVVKVVSVDPLLDETPEKERVIVERMFYRPGNGYSPDTI